MTDKMRSFYSLLISTRTQLLKKREKLALDLKQD